MLFFSIHILFKRIKMD